MSWLLSYLGNSFFALFNPQDRSCRVIVITFWIVSVVEFLATASSRMPARRPARRIDPPAAV